jgi:hypothetical protein
MAAVTIRGDIPNLSLIREDIGSQLADHPDVDAVIFALPNDSHSLGHAEWGEFVLNVGENLVASALWTSLVAAVMKARRRGRIEVEVPDELGGIDGLKAEPTEPDEKGNGDGNEPGSGGQ